MEAFSVHVGVAVPLRRSSVDTDQVIPARFVKRTTRHGYEDALFANLREDPSFVLNDSAYRHGSILVAGENFGVGSSREQAVWALQDYGFRTVLAPSFGDIFRSNASNTGLLAGVLERDRVEELWDRLAEAPRTEVRVDLHECEVATLDGSWNAPFTVPDEARQRLLSGLDRLDTTMAQDAAITAFERRRSTLKPRIGATSQARLGSRG